MFVAIFATFFVRSGVTAPAGHACVCWCLITSSWCLIILSGGLVVVNGCLIKRSKHSYSNESYSNKE